MRISELSRRSGVSVPTIKYYLRLGLLSTGRSTAHNQAEYDDSHLRRLRMIRVFVDIGGLTVRTTREVLAAIDDARLDDRLLGILDAAGSTRREALDGDLRETTQREVETLIRDHGWPVDAGGQAVQRLTDACVAARLLDLPELFGLIDAYAKAVAHVAESDAELARQLALRIGADQPGRVALLEALTTSVVLGEVVLAALHGLAREEILRRLLGEWAPAVS